MPPPTCHHAFAIVVALFAHAHADAGDVSLPAVGVAFSVPDRWKHHVKEEPGRVGVSIRPASDSDATVAVRCRIDRHELPARFRKYTQQELNDAYASRPLDAAGFADRLGSHTGVPVAITAHGQAMLGDSLAYWAASTSSERTGASTADYVSKTYLSQTPGYAWNVQCGSASTRGAAKATAAYRQNEGAFDVFFSSVRFSEPR
ncbi:hypothetical protein OOT46_21685 [Aquabacterium sp. A7-Y]|uniref:hypothetical protein n=1 Tax=Aquabacterium sp. A7-Y TaxID=1349605 RepID=UPI00223DD2F4|nr:hypothetical protein [Aquabacterium sp. A7-Y]MCW7540444.1 hypothetical protein [Aquabacterium sp. A7-Y]